MNVNELATSFWANGFLILEEFFDPLLMDKLNLRILNHYGMNPDWEHDLEFLEKSKTEVIPWFPVREGQQIFDAIEYDSKLDQVTTAILGDGWQNLYLMAMYSKRGTKGQAWHQDCPPEDSSKFNLNRLFYTHDITDQTGGKIVVMPRTHRNPALTVGEPHEDINGQFVLSPKKGTLILLHGHIWHRVLPITGEYRVSINSRAIPKHTPEDVTDIAVYRNMRYRFSTSEFLPQDYIDHTS